ncbi:methyltransferase [Halomonas piscis]|uniref:Methyltransferase n=1 Tax=Halomonas piscis TaxID=3031727 RepID=A0ABY9YWB2_9GAMM|nr:methyltransferase [Halomonas piscis]WNK19111.1 methyltransferase [Halomonas piscis]
MNHAERFQRLTEVLAAWQPLWRPLPFAHCQLPWAGAYPALHRALLALDADALERVEDAPLTAGELAPWLPLAELRALSQLPAYRADKAALPNVWGDHIGGRKWRQLQAFVRCVPAAAGPLIEWCAGKGHLARTLSRLRGQAVTGLEWQPALCEQGRALAERQGAAVTLAEQDVLAEKAGRWLEPGGHAVALHACGDLHAALLRQAAQKGVALTLAPCCYQRTAARHYRPLSMLGQRLSVENELALARDDLALAVEETVTAPAAVSRQRERANAWRLGFDLIQREVRGVDEYLPVPSLAYGRMPTDFAGFCRWAAAQKGLALPSTVLAQRDWEAAGHGRLEQVKRLELVRHAFRRPLEVWLLLDRLMFMQEAGFDATLATFCSRSLTPRNVVLQASPGRPL